MVAQVLIRWGLRASILWVALGLAITLLMPELTETLPEISHTIIPLITATLIAVNLIGSVMILARTGQALNALAVTLVQLPLFTLLFFQIAHHLGPHHFIFDRTPRLQDWLMFTGAHALRAADLFDFLEAYDIRFQSIRHASQLTSACLVAFHLVIDLFLLRVLLTWVTRDSRRANELTHGIPGFMAKLGAKVGWIFVYSFLLAGWLAWWWFTNMLLRDVVLTELSREGLIYLIGTVCVSWLGWELYARGNNRWSYGHWFRQVGWGPIGAVVSLQWFLAFAYPLLFDIGIGLFLTIATVIFLIGRVAVLAQRVMAIHLSWDQNSFQNRDNAATLRFAGLLLPFLLLIHVGFSGFGSLVEEMVQLNPNYLPGLLLRTLILIALLPLIEQISMFVSEWCMKVMDRGVRGNQWSQSQYDRDHVPFRLQPWAIPVGWLAVFALLTPIWWWAATSYTHWRGRDMGWWPIDNLFRVFDFLDVMQIYQIHLAVTPRDFWLSTLTFFCRLLMGLAFVGLIGSLVRTLSLRCLGGFGMTEIDLQHYLQSQQGKASDATLRRARDRLQTLQSNPVSDQQVMHTLGVALLVVGVSFGVVVICQEKGWPNWSKQSQTLSEVVRSAPGPRADVALAELRRLGRYGEPAIPHLAEKAIAGDISYIQAIGDIGGREARAILCRCACDPQREEVAMAAVEALGRGGRKSVTSLLVTIETTPFQNVRSNAYQLIETMGRDVVPILAAWNQSKPHYQFERFIEGIDPYWMESSWVQDAIVNLEPEDVERPIVLPVLPESQPYQPTINPAIFEGNQLTPTQSPLEQMQSLLRQIDATCVQAEQRLGANSTVRLKKIRTYLNDMKDPAIQWDQVSPDTIQAHIAGLRLWQSWFAVNESFYRTLQEFDRIANRPAGLGQIAPSVGPHREVQLARTSLWNAEQTEETIRAQWGRVEALKRDLERDIGRSQSRTP